MHAADSQHVMQFELIRGPDLLDFLEQCGGRVPEPLAKFYFRQLVGAMKHVHALDYCHRDLKLENVMIDLQQQCVKVRAAAISSAELLHKCG